MALGTDVIIGMSTDVAVFLLAFAVANFMTKGFLNVIIAARIAGGKGVIIKIRSATDTYFRVGKLDGDFIRFKDRSKNKRTFDISKGGMYRALNKYWIDIDEQTNAVVTPDYGAVTPYDSVKYDNLLTRALYSPKIQDNKERLIVMLIIIILVVVAFVAWKVVGLEALFNTTRTVSGGNV